MLGQPVSMLVPQVVGFKLAGKLPEGATATDLVLTVTEMLRKKGVVGKFVEFYGDGLANLPLADRATIANMAPEYGATCGIFPIDAETLRYLELSGRPTELIRLVEAYCEGAGAVPRPPGRPRPTYTDTLELDLVDRRAEPRRPEAPAGPRDARPGQGLVRRRSLEAMLAARPTPKPTRPPRASPRPTRQRGPARDRGRRRHRRRRRGPGRARRPQAGRRPPRPRLGRHRRHHQLHEHLEPLGDDRRRPAGEEGRREGADDQALGQGEPRPRLEGRHRLPEATPGSTPTSTSSGSTLVGYGCTTCIGNSGPLPEEISKAIQRGRPRHRRRSSPATATSRGGSTPTSGPTTWPRRRWSSPTPWPARWTST